MYADGGMARLGVSLPNSAYLSTNPNQHASSEQQGKKRNYAHRVLPSDLMILRPAQSAVSNQDHHAEKTTMANRAATKHSVVPNHSESSEIIEMRPSPRQACWKRCAIDIDRQ
jgi:hypothetical protein